MINNKVTNTRISNSDMKKHIKSSREKIIEKEQRSMLFTKIINFLKNNIIVIVALLAILIVVAILVNSNKKIEINETTKIGTLDSGKYKSEIVNLYNREGELNLFLKELNRVQSLIGTYVISNSTLQDNSFSNLIKKLNSEINLEKWNELKSEKSSYYNGTYSIDASGNLKFKFSSKDIEPNWIKDTTISRYIILN